MVSRLYEIIPRAASEFPERKAIIEADTAHSVTYRELDGKINVLCENIRRQGLNKGDRAGILSVNSIDGIAALFAIIKAGGVAVWFNHELESSIIKRQAKDAAACLGTVPVHRGKDPALIIYTSGTTRRPLGAALSHKNLISNASAVAKYARLSKNDRICCVLPLYYIYGLSVLLSHFLAGGTVILDNRFIYPGLILDTIDKYRATGFAGVSGHYAILLRKTDIGKRKLPTLRYFMQAGDAMPPRITRELLSRFPNKRLYLMYGLTEASPRLTYLDPALALKKPDSVGKAVPGVRVKVVDSLGRECEAGVAGEIIASGDNVMLGYWNNKKATAKMIRKGWLFTGDMAFKDKDGDLFIVGRKNKVIKYSKILKLVPKGAL